MNAVSDTSAILSLALVDLVRKVCKIINIHVPSEVKSELLELNKYDDREGCAAEKILDLISRGAIKHVPVQNAAKVESLICADVQHGEAESFVLCMEKGMALLIIDDVDAAYALEGIARAHNITMRISVAVVIELFKKGEITLHQLKTAISTLVKQRRWEGGVLEVLAKRYLSEVE